VRPLVIELLQEGVELRPLLQEVGSRGPGCVLFERQVHALMAAILVRVAGANAFDGDAQSQSPDRETGKLKQEAKGPCYPTASPAAATFPEQAFRGETPGPRLWTPALHTATAGAKHDP
jgi:hypothetical protein